ncbi:spindle pole body component alp14 [Melanomma pulvis-pyrius CBS 109.77]|uniref:Spindle pole body component alp14 n=1 Tax=Melanomma pulvis-pyrius CBS 109.77 TaxID=1314802 RepID=A0A6A6WS54_9PLEO|nr:spindle pole body component alp14 [Melanomma pulvis-pyrius CBS 109.77]
MADAEEDFTALPLPDRFIHKNWKVRKEGYEAAAKEFSLAASEADPVVRQFVQDAGIWKGVVGDANVAAQQEGLAALCSFLEIAGPQGCTRTRQHTVSVIAEKCLSSTRAVAKQKALEALMLYVELDKPDPIIEELLPALSNKQPKVIAATLDALTQLYHAYGCKTIEPKSVLKALPKIYGHADKNVRAKAQELTVELYRWLKEAMKPLFWADLKPIQQQDLDKLFEKVKDEPAPKQERLLRSQQAAKEVAMAAGAEEEEEEEEEEVVIDLEPDFDPVDVLSKIPQDYTEKLASSKWKDRKETLDEVQKALNHPLIAEGPFDELIRGFAKSMKDANISVVMTAANCVELLAKGLRKKFAKYRSQIMGPILERLKEKKQAVTDSLGAALDAVFASSTLTDCLEDISECLKHKNPQVKLETTRFLIRCLKTTREVPSAAEVKSIADSSTKLLTESQEVQRAAAAEVFGTLWKIMGDRMMGPHLDGLDEIRKTKIKEFFETAEVKAKYKPKPVAAPKPVAPPAGKRPLGKKPPIGTKKRAPPAAAAAPPPPREEPEPTAPLAPKPTSRPAPSKLGAPKSGLAPPSRLGGLKKPGSALVAPSPRRAVVSPPLEDEAPIAPPKLGLAGRGLAGRPLGKPQVEQMQVPISQAPTGLGLVERAELDELRAEVERLRRQNEDVRSERTYLNSQISELQNQNAQLIEDHTRDVLSIKAKETQLVRARSDYEAAEQTVQNQRREVDRLKRELSRQVRATSPPPTDLAEQIYTDSNGSGRYGDSGYGSQGLYGRARGVANGPLSPNGEGKENFDSSSRPGSNLSGKLSPLRHGVGRESAMSSMSSRGGRLSPAETSASSMEPPRQFETTRQSQASAGAESWKRAAEVTQNLKQRIEMMKAKQGIGRPQQ